MTPTDQLTLPYTTVLGLQYLVGGIPPEVNYFLDQVILVRKPLRRVHMNYEANIQ